MGTQLVRYLIIKSLFLAEPQSATTKPSVHHAEEAFWSVLVV